MLTREIEWWPTGATKPQTVRVSIGLPEPHPTLGGYECKVTVDGFGQGYSTSFHDAEGMIALTSALNMVPDAIEYNVQKAGGGRITSRLRLIEDQDAPEEEARS